MNAKQREALHDRLDLARVELSGQLAELSKARDLLIVYGDRADLENPAVIRRARAICRHAFTRIKS